MTRDEICALVADYMRCAVTTDTLGWLVYRCLGMSTLSDETAFDKINATKHLSRCGDRQQSLKPNVFHRGSTWLTSIVSSLPISSYSQLTTTSRSSSSMEPIPQQIIDEPRHWLLLANTAAAKKSQNTAKNSSSSSCIAKTTENHEEHCTNSERLRHRHPIVTLGSSPAMV